MERNLVLDAGALIGVERGSRVLAVLIEQIHELDGETIIPASALAQVWRGGPTSARLAQLIGGSDIDILSEERAKEIGVRLGARSGSDVTDAHVACCAIERRSPVATSDRDDIEALIAPDEQVRLIPV
jgi:predicted nucleic acid-binding protein